jgi:uncharacterized membrane protein
MHMKGESSVIVKLVVLAVGIKILTYVAGNYTSTDIFGASVASLLGIVDLVFYGIVALIVLLIPYYLSKRRKKNAVPDRSRPVERK